MIGVGSDLRYGYPFGNCIGFWLADKDSVNDDIHDMDRLMVHWIVNDCDLGKVSVYTPSRGCVGLHVVWIIYMR